MKRKLVKRVVKVNLSNLAPSLFVGLVFLICSLGFMTRAFSESSFTSSPKTTTRKPPLLPQDVDGLVKNAKAASKDERKEMLNALAQPDPRSGATLGDKYFALLDDNDLDIRDAAVRACGNMNEQRAIPKIRTILKSLPKHSFDSEAVVMSKKAFDEEYVHGELAAETLAKMKDMQALPEILNRDTLAVSWSAIIPAYGASALPQVIEKARSHDSRIKALAQQTIISIHDADAAPQLQTLLSDSDNSLRNIAVLALSQLDSSEAILSAEFAYNQLDENGKSYFVEGCLKHCDHQKAVKYLKLFMSSSKPSAQKSMVLTNLANSFQSEAVPYLEQYLNDKDDAVREGAACQLAKITGRLYPYSENNSTRLYESDCRAIQKLKQKK